MDYFQKLTLEGTFSRAGHVFSSKWAVFLTISVAAYLVYFAASVFMIFMFAGLINYSNGGGISDPNTVMAMLVDLAVYYAVMCVADGAIIRAVTEMYVGQVPTVDGTLQFGLSKLHRLFGNAVVIGAAVGVPAVLLFLLFVWISGGAQVAVLMFNFLFLIAVIVVSVLTYHTYPIIMVEDGGILDSIQRSYELSKGHRVYIFSVLLLFFATKMILQIICTAIAFNLGGAGVVIMELIKLLINVVFATLGSILQAVVYVSVRCDKEGLSHQVMVTELFGPVQEDGETSYVAASTTEDGGMATTAAHASPEKVDAAKDGSVV